MGITGKSFTGYSSLLSFTMSESSVHDGAQDPKKSVSEHGSIAAAEIQTPARPPIVYSSPKAFARSFAARWKSIWTRRFILSLLAGQVASLCITCTNVTTTELVNRGWTLSTTQGIFLYVIHRQIKANFTRFTSVFSYFCLFIIYTPYTIYQCMWIFWSLHVNGSIHIW